MLIMAQIVRALYHVMDNNWLILNYLYQDGSIISMRQVSGVELQFK
jgi:hypothetical protein